eukprot:CAMPEP_0203757992 /NCGR_PEP_ID=MMETSP0098-20131031/10797_1 /ASSEMBLY_ACC=CAM_ASM_000208 /TAXON_ID=96639 /ORGANISM=" , Strain NY0313808BC1" /LENGTH=646 /DNA_ID=CAMNT_0050650239 /DNA_START=602 /DNA_END=2539 /DNA_ORIENTATION=-
MSIDATFLIAGVPAFMEPFKGAANAVGGMYSAMDEAGAYNFIQECCNFNGEMPKKDDGAQDCCNFGEEMPKKGRDWSETSFCEEKQEQDRMKEEQQDAQVVPLNSLNGGYRFSLEDVFALLLAARNGDWSQNIPQRPQASPISPRCPCFYVSNNLKRELPENEIERLLGEKASLVAVKYQGFSNGEIWWSPQHGNRLGLIARNMTRKTRGTVSGAKHGYSGRWYALLERGSEDVQVSRLNCRLFVVHGCPSFVQFWQNENIPVPTAIEHKVKKRKATKQEEPEPLDDTALSGSTCPSSGFHVLNSGLYINGDCVIDGDLVCHSVRVSGDLTVDQAIYGQVMTPPSAADYAEWFPKLDDKQDICCGDVVRLASPEQKITLDTQGDGPILVVSTNPSVSAGVPYDEKERELGALCGFIGQVPVKVLGPVRCGDNLVASGNSDGFAVVADSRYDGLKSPLGVAMEGCGPGKHVVNSLVRWPYSSDYKINRLSATTLLKDVSRGWQGLFAFFAFSLLEMLYLRSPSFPHAPLCTVVSCSQLVFALWLFMHYPVYPEFAFRDVWAGFVLCLGDAYVSIYYVLGELYTATSDTQQPATVAQIRSLIVATVATCVHIVFVAMLAFVFWKARLAIKQFPHEPSTKRHDWAKKVW